MNANRDVSKWVWMYSQSCKRITYPYTLICMYVRTCVYVCMYVVCMYVCMYVCMMYVFLRFLWTQHAEQKKKIIRRFP